MKRDGSLDAWLAQRRAACDLVVTPLPWRDSGAWRLAGGALRHVTGGFFAVVGIRAASDVVGLDGLCGPIIDQPEIGILGFLVRRADGGTQWLVQAKAEPGNVGAVQLAPSVQATRSNYTRLHGGAPTPYLDCFTGGAPDAGVVADSLQSEQGNRFLGKYNRNVTVLVPGQGPQPVSADWRWTDAAELRAMLATDFAVNTDARSVLVCSDWRLLADGEPFARWRGTTGWGAALLASFAAQGATECAAAATAALDWLAARRAAVRLDLELLPLDALPGWTLTADGLVALRDGRMAIRVHEVRVSGREVDHWDQPFVLGHGEEAVVLLCQQRGGMLRFLLRASVEAGFRERVQFGPSWQSDDVTAGNGVADRLAAVFGQARQRGSTLQSDEGGRFHRSVCRYRVLELDPAAVLEVEDSGYLWLSLGQIHRLLPTPGAFSNEARSALSMVLAAL